MAARKLAPGVVALCAAITITVVVVNANSTPPRTTAEFCKVYNQQKNQYLAQYGRPTSNGLQALGNIIGAMSDWVPIFERLDQVAPPSIEPDVHTILDSLKQEEQAAGQEFSNPLGALGSGLEASMMSSSSWNRLSAFVQKNCTAGTS